VSAILSSTVDVVAPVESGVRATLTKLEAECLQARAEVMAAIAEHGLDAVFLARGESLERTLEDIRAALSRVDAGTYGRCATCGGAIPPERLQLRPFAATCVPCAGATR
jgi:RNA polymerase-binding transcription factor DksA